MAINENIKFFGINIDEYLNWKAHATYLGKKIEIWYSIQIVSKYLNTKSIKIIFYANFEAYKKEC